MHACSVNTVFDSAKILPFLSGTPAVFESLGVLSPDEGFPFEQSSPQWTPADGEIPHKARSRRELHGSGMSKFVSVEL